MVAAVRIELKDPGRADQVRDFFLRLGADASVAADGIVDARFPEDALNDDVDAEELLQSWTALNRTDAQVVPGAASAPANPPAALFEILPREHPRQGAPPPRLGDLMVGKGYITEEQLATALVESRSTGERLGQVLIRNGWAYEQDLARALSEQWALPFVNIALVGVDGSALRLLPREVGMEANAIPVRFVDGAVQVAFADPSDPGSLAAVREHITSIAPAVAEYSDIEMAWRSVRSA
jgi:hypothetical protein